VLDDTDAVVTLLDGLAADVITRQESGASTSKSETSATNPVVSVNNAVGV
jgi:hypothetical protein